MVTITVKPFPAGDTCECGQPAMPDVVTIQHCTNDETGKSTTHGPDALCAGCLDIALDDHAYGVVVIQLAQFELVQLY